MVPIQYAVNKKVIQAVDVQFSFRNFISQNIIDDLRKNSLSWTH